MSTLSRSLILIRFLLHAVIPVCLADHGKRNFAPATAIIAAIFPYAMTTFHNQQDFALQQNSRCDPRRKAYRNHPLDYWPSRYPWARLTLLPVNRAARIYHKPIATKVNGRVPRCYSALFDFSLKAANSLNSSMTSPLLRILCWAWVADIPTRREKAEAGKALKKSSSVVSSPIPNMKS